MRKKKQLKKQEFIDNKISDINSNLNKGLLFTQLKDNISYMKKLFVDDDLFIIREIENNYNLNFRCAIAYCEGVVESNVINESIIKPLMTSQMIRSDDNLIDYILNNIVQICNVKKTKIIKDIIENVTYGDVILFIDGSAEVLILNTKKLETRAIIEPENEKILFGPREGFTELLLTNLSLIRRKVRSNKLKFKYLNLGKQTNTDACICYIDDIVDKKILAQLYKRLKKIKIDGVLDTNYINELIRDAPFSLFNSIGHTEKPDVVVGKLLEGRIAIVLEGTPMVLTIPFLFVENFQSGEDYYLNYYYTSFARIIRFLAFTLSILVPSFYIAIVAFHQEMIPTQLFINIAMERQNVPLPTAIEAIAVLFVFDILKETGLRMPTGVGQSLSIVGAIVIGQAAVEAKLVAGPMIIVIAFAGITSLLVPRLSPAVVFLRTFLLLLGSTLGLFGITIGLSLIVVDILNLKSLGVPQLTLSGDIKYQPNKDVMFRSPWSKMKKRPKLITSNLTRM